MDRKRETNSMVTFVASSFVPGFRAHFKDHKQMHFPGRVWPSGLIALATDGIGGHTLGCSGFLFFVSVPSLLRVIVLRMWLRMCGGPDGG
jgi:hypothetical protein